MSIVRCCKVDVAALQWIVEIPPFYWEHTAEAIDYAFMYHHGKMIIILILMVVVMMMIMALVMMMMMLVVMIMIMFKTIWADLTSARHGKCWKPPQNTNLPASEVVPTFAPLWSSAWASQWSSGAVELHSTNCEEKSTSRGERGSRPAKRRAFKSLHFTTAPLKWRGAKQGTNEVFFFA